MGPAIMGLIRLRESEKHEVKKHVSFYGDGLKDGDKLREINTLMESHHAIGAKRKLEGVEEGGSRKG